MSPYRKRNERHGSNHTQFFVLLRSTNSVLIGIVCLSAIIIFYYSFHTFFLSRRYLVFDATQLSNQGAGNIMKGLYAAHLLGREFDRTVCVVYPDFEHFFVALGHDQDHCRNVIARSKTNVQRLVLLDYENIDECHVKKILASLDAVVIVTGNTYPQWPSLTPPLIFHELYQPRNNSIIGSNMDVVVHLRSPDNDKFDPRDGLDESSLQMMESLVKASPVFLVSNNVDHYQRFSHIWSHPPWKSISHSANGIVWGSNHRVTLSRGKDVDMQRNVHQMWMDWYTIRTAKVVYHTRSAFSESAILWSDGATSYTFVKRNNGHLGVQADDFTAGRAMPLSQRNDLQQCGLYEQRVRENQALFDGLQFSNRP